ncbi:NADH-quinone oxidoreductase subunit L [Odoribacter sp. OttesenSCG-928-J03]|nr:NADH-quinone oxidoreductase subunit L [Odoribacter sp. OttesenSCG-928-J03]MDL2282968.1 NADH-quinone oxidoreductase subunit L [Odoribacter sp. OttesenSCG-928-G04]
MEWTLLIILIPLCMFLLLGLTGYKMKPVWAGIVGTIAIATATLLSWYVAYHYFFRVGEVDGVFQKIIPFAVEWLRFTDKLHIDLGILLDPISVMMLVVITTVSLMVHTYSLAYMHGEKGFQRYYAFLSLFTFSMLGLVVATNIFQMYLFWELVGVSSYLLIGFYYTKPQAVSASKKAFIVTRFADLGFLIGILILSYYTGTFDLSTLTANEGGLVIASTAGASFMGLSVASWAMALIFMGGAGKSAMFPLHIWLPDAMEGPTPVSALIHAATMVVAGVYLVARMFPVYVFAAPDVLTMIAYVGAFTALFAAIIAITQTDIKRVLAFSTISQIAYMMVALGVSGYGGHDGLGYMASMFHLFTHAFFKALLFLGAGAVIHAVHSNEMGQMGALRKYMPVTHITFLIACLAISGIPPFSGFFSKDEILVAAFAHDKVLFVTLWIVAGLTAFYMFRLYYNIFWGKEKTYEHRPQEAPVAMTLPLILLAVFSCATGFIPFSKFISSDGMPFATHIEWGVAASGIVVALIGIGAATVLYKKGSEKPDRIVAGIPGLYKAALHKFYMDEVWIFITKTVIFKWICAPIAWFDKHIIDGSMDGLGWATQRLSSSIKGFQSGKVQFYALVFILGTLIVLLWALFI